MNILSPELSDQNRSVVLKILNSALEAAHPRKSIHRYVKRNGSHITIGQQVYVLSQYRKIIVVGIGKAVLEMARGLTDIIGKEISEGILVTKHIDPNIDDFYLYGIKIFSGDHPIPSERSVVAAHEIMRIVEQATAEDLVICLISGGGSALVTLPEESISLHDMQQVTEMLLKCGSDINEVNHVRKKLDRIKGGGLALQAAPAKVVALILSDVIGSDPAIIASGPTVVAGNQNDDPVPSIIKKYNLEDRLPDSVRKLLAGGFGKHSRAVNIESQSAQVYNVIISNNYIAAKASTLMAEREGYNSMLVSTYLRGEARHVGRMLAGILSQVAETGDPIQRPACLVFGGETTVTLKGDGKGGRNLELALGSVMDIKDLVDVALITFATDGEDGVTDAAGALVTGETRNRGELLGLDENEYLHRNDSFHYFKALGNIISCGPTGTNVNDLVFLFAFTKTIK
jgi:glycerate 2-kinase